MKVLSTIKPYYVNGEKVVVGDRRELIVNTMWNENKIVELRFKFDGENDCAFSVRADELIAAVENALHRPWDGLS